MELRLAGQAEEDLKFFLKTGQTGVLKKIEKLFNEIKATPFAGTGKPEPLKYSLSGCWS